MDKSIDRITRQLDFLLEGSLGLNIYPRFRIFALVSGRRPSLSSKPLHAGLEMAAVYFLAFVVLPWLIFWWRGSIPLSLWPLLVFQSYGALWAGWATASTRIVSRSIRDIITRTVLPALSREALIYVGREFDSRYMRRFKCALYMISWGIGLAAAGASGLLIRRDLALTFNPTGLEMAFWCLGWTLLYTTAAKVVIIARFYGIFAEALARDSGSLFWPNASASSAVASVALVGRHVLMFWVSIAVSIALILPFGAYVLGLVAPTAAVDMPAVLPTGLRGAGFMVAHLVGTAIFSIGVGSLVFLRSEGQLRSAIRAASAAGLRKIEARIARLPKPLEGRGLEHLAKLKALHTEVAGGGTSTLVFSGLSLIVPFLPLLTLFLKQWLER